MQAPQENEIRQQLEKICSSAKFKDAGRARRFLEFIVGEALAGKSSELKENVVGVSVFDRSADYDPRLDSIVRVEAGRLRTKLNDYYNEDGHVDQIEILLRKGSYAPDFSWRRAQRPEIETPMDDVATPEAPLDGTPKRSTRNLLAAAAIAIVLILGTVLAIDRFGQPTVPTTRIAVLPFTPYSKDESERVIAAQLTQKVTAEFVKLDVFNVVPSTSVRAYDDRRPGVREIAAALQADILLEARTTMEGSNVRVEVRLSDGALDRKFWVGDKYSGENMDELAQQIARAANEAVSTRKNKKKQGT